MEIKELDKMLIELGKKREMQKWSVTENCFGPIQRLKIFLGNHKKKEIFKAVRERSQEVVVTCTREASEQEALLRDACTFDSDFIKQFLIKIYTFFSGEEYMAFTLKRREKAILSIPKYPGEDVTLIASNTMIEMIKTIAMNNHLSRGINLTSNYKKLIEILESGNYYSLFKDDLSDGKPFLLFDYNAGMSHEEALKFEINDFPGLKSEHGFRGEVNFQSNRDVMKGFPIELMVRDLINLRIEQPDLSQEQLLDKIMEEVTIKYANLINDRQMN